MKALLRSVTSDLSPLYVQPSTRIRLVSGYFTVTGGLFLAALAGMAASAAAGWTAMHTLFTERPGAVAFAAAVSLGWLWTGHLLGRGERAGGILAIVTLVVPLVAWAVGQPISGTSIFLSALGAAAVATSWRELD
jgi:hypothetical protein